MRCPACQSENEAGRKFCGECGAPLAQACPSCGAANPPAVKVCGECGSALTAAAPVPAAVQPAAERRLVSVLFADLVGFTSLTEHRDAEFVRELLTRYFDTARRLVERYGGVVEKFIGDAVMAVWGAPVAQEDDAERATRTALDLVAAVSALSDEFGSTELRLRAGVMTGEAAVTLGVAGQGMVAGDLVNTASRVQALADPGVVLVDDATRHATEAAIAYEDAGEHLLKGKTVPTRVHSALRVIAARRGEGRSVGLEAPFIGREREFRLVKELFHASAEERRAMLVSMSGVAGIGKSRLTWEFEKYIDGLAHDVLWHRGRCLAYGDGVAYWAIGEMVRMRARIAEDDAPEVARTKLRDTLQQHIPLDADRAFLEPRLAHLIGLAERTAPDKEDLFSAWRLFFERMAERSPVVMVFEDLQWADAGLLDFIEYLLDWSRSYPIYLLTASRPDLATRRPSWGAAQRDFTSIFLEPLEAAEVATMLDGLVPGLPTDLRGRIVERAEGVPLYAVETVRMLLDRGMVTREGDRYRVIGAVDALAVPETLHALVAARLDGLEPEERRLLGDAAVLGKSFTREGLAALSGQSADALAPVVVSLLRKEILTQQSDPLSPERGQLAFMQDLLRRVTYETMSKRERKGRHLAAAAHLLAEPAGDEELAGIVASHYMDAFRAAEDDPDAEELKRTARAMLVRAGERATSLAAGAEAAAYFERAVELSDDPPQRSQLLELAGAALTQAGDTRQAVERYREAATLLEQIGEQRAAARVSGRLAEALRFDGRADQALEVLQQAYTALVDGPRDADLAFVAAEYARVAFFVDRYELALEPIELALDLAEALKLPQVLAEALNTKGVMLFRRSTESEALIRQAVRVALSHDLPPTALRAQFNLSGLFMEHDRYREATELLHEAIELARRRGYRQWELPLVTQLADTLSSLGDWDEAKAVIAQVEAGGMREALAAAGVLHVEARLAHGRGAYDRLAELVGQLEHLRTSGDRQDQGSYHYAEAVLKRSEGRFPEAIELARKASTISRSLHQLHYATEGFVESVEAAMDADDLETAERLVAEMENLDPVDRRPLLDAQVARLRGRLCSMGSGNGADEAFSAAIDGFRAITARYWLAVALFEYGEWLRSEDRRAEAEPLLADSAVRFAELRAQRWLDRLAAMDVGIEIAS